MITSKKKVAVLLTLSLLLILGGSVLGYQLGASPDSEDILEGDDVIVLDNRDIESLGIQPLDVYSNSYGSAKSLQTYVFTLEEFSKYIKSSIPNKVSLITHLSDKKYDISIKSGGDEIIATKFKGCALDPIYNEQLCEFETISYRDFDKKVFIEISKVSGGKDE